MELELIKQQSILTVGGSCANCDSDYEAFEAFRMLMRYEEDCSYITEPFNFCKECSVEASMQGGL